MRKVSRTTITPSDELLLWQGFQAGEEEAFERIFYLYHHKLCNYGFKIIPDKDVIQDCVQDLFIYLWNNRARLTFGGGMNLYLVKSLRGKLLRMLNKQKKFAHRSISGEEQEPEFSFFSIEDTLVAEQTQREQHEQLLKALNSLTKRQREVIYLKFFLDLSYDEISEITSLSYQVTRNYACQAVKVLREKIELTVSIVLITHLFS